MRRYSEVGGSFLESSQWFQNSIPRWDAPKYITYHIPPYLSLRENVIMTCTPSVSQRKFLDMIKKFDANDIGYIFMDMEDHLETVYKKVEHSQAAIRDELNKWIMMEKDRILANHLRGPGLKNRGL
ncbi:uncharacterized protein O3C94_009110 [Discoglossus pictus]